MDYIFKVIYFSIYTVTTIKFCLKSKDSRPFHGKKWSKELCMVCDSYFEHKEEILLQVYNMLFCE